MSIDVRGRIDPRAPMCVYVCECQCVYTNELGEEGDVNHPVRTVFCDYLYMNAFKAGTSHEINRRCGAQDTVVQLEIIWIHYSEDATVRLLRSTYVTVCSRW